MKKILLVGCGHMGSALLKAWSRKTNYNISVIDPYKNIILKKKYPKKIKFYKTINEINNINSFSVVVFAIDNG